MELIRAELGGGPGRSMVAPGSPGGRDGLVGIDVAPRDVDGVAHTVVQLLLDDDVPGFDRGLLDRPMVAELSVGDRVVAREAFDHDVFRRRLLAERQAGTSTTRGILVLTEGEPPPPWVRLAFLPVPVESTADHTSRIITTTVPELLAGVDEAYARGEVTDEERRALIVSIEQRHPIGE